MLLELFRSMRFPNIEWFHSLYLPVEYDKDSISWLKIDYAANETNSRVQRYSGQVERIYQVSDLAELRVKNRRTLTRHWSRIFSAFGL